MFLNFTLTQVRSDFCVAPLYFPLSLLTRVLPLLTRVLYILTVPDQKRRQEVVTKRYVGQ